MEIIKGFYQRLIDTRQSETEPIVDWEARETQLQALMAELYSDGKRAVSKSMQFVNWIRSQLVSEVSNDLRYVSEKVNTITQIKSAERGLGDYENVFTTDEAFQIIKSALDRKIDVSLMDGYYAAKIVNITVSKFNAVQYDLSIEVEHPENRRETVHFDHDCFLRIKVNKYNYCVS